MEKCEAKYMDQDGVLFECTIDKDVHTFTPGLPHVGHKKLAKYGPEVTRHLLVEWTDPVFTGEDA